MKKVTNIKNELLKTIIYDENLFIDLSDIGNILGIVIGKYIDENEVGFQKDDFLNGIKHGISLSDGTHDKK